MTMNPDLVYQLVASNPNLKNLVEQTARLVQVQQQAQQMAPVLQQMASNPIGAMNGYVDWQNQQQTAAGQQPPVQQPPQNQQGGQTVGMFEQAMAIVEEFRKGFAAINNNLKEVHDMCTANQAAISALNDKMGDVPVDKVKNNAGSGKS